MQGTPLNFDIVFHFMVLVVCDTVLTTRFLLVWSHGTKKKKPGYVYDFGFVPGYVSRVFHASKLTTTLRNTKTKHPGRTKGFTHRPTRIYARKGYDSWIQSLDPKGECAIKKPEKHAHKALFAPYVVVFRF